MNENPYKTPEAEIVDRDNGNQFYVVALPKFTILYFSTLGVYIVYWFYKNWECYKAYHQNAIWAIPRGIFNIFFIHSLFEKIDNSLKKEDKVFYWNPRGLATCYVLIFIMSQGLDRLVMKQIGSPHTDLLSMLMLPVMYLVFVKPQQAINLCHDDPSGNGNADLTVVNCIWIVLGLLVWVLVLLGLLFLFGLIDGKNLASAFLY